MNKIAVRFEFDLAFQWRNYLEFSSLIPQEESGQYVEYKFSVKISKTNNALR